MKSFNKKIVLILALSLLSLSLFACSKGGENQEKVKKLP